MGDPHKDAGREEEAGLQATGKTVNNRQGPHQKHCKASATSTIWQTTRTIAWLKQSGSQDPESGFNGRWNQPHASSGSAWVLSRLSAFPNVRKHAGELETVPSPCFRTLAAGRGSSGPLTLTSGRMDGWLAGNSQETGSKTQDSGNRRNRFLNKCVFGTPDPHQVSAEGGGTSLPPDPPPLCKCLWEVFQRPASSSGEEGGVEEGYRGGAAQVPLSSDAPPPLSAVKMFGTPHLTSPAPRPPLTFIPPTPPSQSPV